MTKLSAKLQDKLEILKDNKYALKLWRLYTKYYHRTYSTFEEENERFAKFINNLKLIIKENLRYDKGLKSFRLQLNEFGDMSLDEFRQKLTGLNPDGRGESGDGEILDRRRNPRIKRFLLDTIAEKIGNKIKKKVKEKISYRRRRPKYRGAAKGTIDYRRYMNPVENQGRCGFVSCTK